ncbi:hypothetical protein TNIN_229701 [Trichonephila inaurata madagascariensis]|uniref:Uncharacterized protein n=1 Tax=Trichonephila inaurata madagascariensis TaxID=2747483 RepID=A0A8X6MHG3_9ARAC|nr:hypothetical protein TNIN_229701 [Trichonephila inaurata madagascariensis]
MLEAVTSLLPTSCPRDNFELTLAQTSMLFHVLFYLFKSQIQTSKATNNSTIKSYGFLTLFLDLRIRRHFSWRSVIADVPLPLLVQLGC